MPTLFILEQAENYQQFFSKLLADRYEIKSFNDFQAIEKEITSADLLLLDVEMIDDGQLQQNLHSLKEISNLTRNDFICTLLVTSKEELSVKQQNVS